jgi:large subunit ribosomal protein L30
MSKIKITQVKSGIDRMARQKRTLVALGLGKVLKSVEVEATPQILGMVKTVHHLVKVEENFEPAVKQAREKGYAVTSAN